MYCVQLEKTVVMITQEHSHPMNEIVQPIYLEINCRSFSFFLEDLEAQAKEHAGSTSCKGAWCSVEAAAGIQKSINTETASKSKAKVFFRVFY